MIGGADLTSVEAELSAGGPGGFALTFAVEKNSPLIAPFLLADGTPVPLRVVLVVTLNGVAEVIADGVMTDHQLTPGAAGRTATLTVRGTDLTALMDLIPFDGLPYPGTPVEARVLAVLAKYAALGVVPMIIPRAVLDVDDPLERIYRHQGTDLEYLRQLAAEAGYMFHLTPAPGTTTAYWGPELKVGPPQPALTADADVETNVESLSFTFTNDRQVLPIVMVHNQLTKIPISVPGVGLLNPPLGAVPPIPRRVEIVRGMARRSIPQAILFGLGRAAGSADSSKATRTTRSGSGASGGAGRSCRRWPGRCRRACPGSPSRRRRRTASS